MKALTRIRDRDRIAEAEQIRRGVSMWLASKAVKTRAERSGHDLSRCHGGLTSAARQATACDIPLRSNSHRSELFLVGARKRTFPDVFSIRRCPRDPAQNPRKSASQANGRTPGIALAVTYRER
jgi:hypothetical protein